MLVVSDMRVKYGHLTATNTGTYIRHTVIVSGSSMLIIGICITGLSSIPHDFICLFWIPTDKCTST